MLRSVVNYDSCMTEKIGHCNTRKIWCAYFCIGKSRVRSPALVFRTSPISRSTLSERRRILLWCLSKCCTVSESRDSKTLSSNGISASANLRVVCKDWTSLNVSFSRLQTNVFGFSRFDSKSNLKFPTPLFLRILAGKLNKSVGQLWDFRNNLR